MSAPLSTVNAQLSLTNVLSTKNVHQLLHRKSVYRGKRYEPPSGEQHPRYNTLAAVFRTISWGPYSDTNSAQVAQRPKNRRHLVGVQLLSLSEVADLMKSNLAPNPFPKQFSSIFFMKLRYSYEISPTHMLSLHTSHLPKMITRKVLRSSAARSVRANTRAKCTPSKVRKFSSSTSSTTTPSPSSNATSVSSFGAFTNELDRIAPRFEIHGSQIKILRTPAEFYETLKVWKHSQESGEGMVC